jgi:hypothetical protein
MGSERSPPGGFIRGGRIIESEKLWTIEKAQKSNSKI